ncbi:DgyrCDS14083 [Dimorphilus gyrociliatus]|uniref:DgyrCDS14083 n=1 Tax=Dimorphilus gyrociliatus TaxID=2664684 RepID=A0A7I8WCI8_9ANNE|nr:DgyrCDS14083 [Dimorphilus gyrociliatus]
MYTSLLLCMILFAFQFYPIDSIVTYKNCNEAIWMNKESGDYFIQPLAEGGIANVYCEIQNNFTLVSFVKPNTKPNTYLRQVPAKTYFISYSNFTDNDMSKFMEEAKFNCRQFFNYTERNAHISHQKFTFWDNTVIPLQSNIDGGCLCLISGVCEISGSPNTSCNAISEAVDTEQYTDYGRIAVKKERLPVKAVTFGDIDGSHEYIYYTLEDLICEEEIYPKVNVLETSDFCSSTNWNILFDANSTSFQSLTIKQQGGDCENIMLFGRVPQKYQSCKRIETNSCEYDCEIASDEFHIYINEKTNINICELEFRYQNLK